MKTIFRLTVLLALMAGVCSAQIIIQTQQAGTTNGTFKKYFVLNCVSGLNCTVSGSTLSITVTGTNLASPGPIGGTTPSTGAFTALTATTFNKLTLTQPATGSTLTLPDGTTATGPSVSSSLVGTLSAQVGNTDTVACPNNTTANFSTTYTIPANYLVANKLLRITATWSATTSAASTPATAINLNIGGTNVYLGGQTINASTTARQIMMTWLVQGSAVASASAAVYTTPAVGYISANAAFTPFATGAGSPTQPVSLATNGTMVVQPILFCSANTAGNTFTLQQFVVEALN